MRELEHTIERAVVLANGPSLSPMDLSLAPSVRTTQPLSLQDVMREHARVILGNNDGNRSATARELQISRNRLARLLDEDE